MESDVMALCFIGILTGVGFLVVIGFNNVRLHLRSRLNYRRLLAQQTERIVMPNPSRKWGFDESMGVAWSEREPQHPIDLELD